jgi:O-antigen/teichoic acid export membrane protein
MLPALSVIQDDKERVKRAFIKATSFIALVTFPMVSGLWAVTPHAVYTLLGEKWADVIPIFQVLCIVGLLHSVATNVGWIFLSQGRVDLMLKLQYGFCFFILLSFLIGIKWGPIGVAVCYSIVSVLLMPVSFMVAGSIIDMTFGDVVRAISGIFGCAMLMVLGVWSFGLLLPSTWPHWAFLVIQSSLGVVIYVALIHFFRLSAYLEIRNLFIMNIWPKFKGTGTIIRRHGTAR